MITRRTAIKTLGSLLAGGSVLTSTAAADADRPPGASIVEESSEKIVLEYDSGRTLKLTYDEQLIGEYQPQLVLDGVEPEPLAYHGLHAESDQSTLNAVSGFTHYPFQDGVSGQDSHLGDHEPIIVWYDQSSGDVERVDYAAYHWFRGNIRGANLDFAGDQSHRPVFRVDPDYHHYYVYQGDLAGEQIQQENLIESIDRWLSHGLDEDLALSQPYDPWAMLARNSWWRHSTGNQIDAALKALWFNLGVSDARSTADVDEVRAW